jgi:hypothetical protein
VSVRARFTYCSSAGQGNEDGHARDLKRHADHARLLEQHIVALVDACDSRVEADRHLRGVRALEYLHCSRICATWPYAVRCELKTREHQEAGATY